MEKHHFSALHGVLLLNFRSELTNTKFVNRCSLNPLTTTVQTTKPAPTSDVSKALQIRWYRCPIDKQLLRELMTQMIGVGCFWR